jgi:iron-sulfur cluster repair protein YtfE (RIC family)
MAGFFSRFGKPQAQTPTTPQPGGAPAGGGTEGLAAFFLGDHRSIDQSWASIEKAGGGAETGPLFEAFDKALRRHFAMEEEVMFPAFEQVSGMTGGGPTFVMRSEHEQMRGVLDQMEASLAKGEIDELLDLGDTLLMLIQQHNSKEEGILYPAADGMLGAQWSEMHGQLKGYFDQE